MDRRQFIKDSAVTAVGLGIGAKSLASVIPVQQNAVKAEETTGAGRLIISEPVLQNYAETSMGVAFAVSDMANGYVIYGRKPDLSDGRKVKCGGFRTTDMNDKVMLVRLTGLKPSTKYYHRQRGIRQHPQFHDGRAKVQGAFLRPERHAWAHVHAGPAYGQGGITRTFLRGDER